MIENFSDKKYPFENLVLEGGGNKGMAYVGAIQVFEEAGVLKNIKRFCGASAGSIVAALLAVGFTCDEVKSFLNEDLREILFDHRFGYFSLLPNILTGYGWNPGKGILNWLGNALDKKTGNADITFKGVHELYKKELCIVVTNLSQMSTEYMHPKTTPEIPIRLAVRMSSSLPVMFQAVSHRTSRTHETCDEDDVYVDGGLLCNYPIHAFDGWWLSMNREDSLFSRYANLDNMSKLFAKSNRFGKWNEKSLGIMLYLHSETELMKEKLMERLGEQKVPRPPQSKLFMQRKHIEERQAKAKDEHKLIMNSMKRFMEELYRLNFDSDDIIELKEMREVLEKVTFMEIISFAQSKGVDLQTQFIGYTRKHIDSFGSFLSTMQEALSVNIKRLYVEERDINRTIGVDTDYIETTDFDLEPCDKEFLLESGRRAAIAFLRVHTKAHIENGCVDHFQ